MASGASSPGGDVRRETFRSPLLGRDWDYVLYTPAGYATSGLLYPVLYLLHGSHGDPEDFVAAGGLRETADRLIAARVIPPVLIVAPAAGTSWYVDRGDTPMESAFLRDLIPYVESAERVRAVRRARLIGGVSMGGAGALRFALKRPDLFCAAALLSPAVYAGAPPPGSSAYDRFCTTGQDGAPRFDAAAWSRQCYPALLPAYGRARHPIRFYIDSGERDELNIHAAAFRLYQALRERRQPARFRLTRGGHDWDTWTQNLEGALRYVLAEIDGPAPPQSSSDGPHQPGK